jgi:hypothetical protein
MKKLFDEEWITFGLREYFRNDALGRRLSTQVVQHGGHFAAGEALEPHFGRESAADEIFERPCQVRCDIRLRITIGADNHQRLIREPPRDVIQQGQGRVVRPMKIFENYQHRASGSAARGEVEERVEQMAPSLSR